MDIGDFFKGLGINYAITFITIGFGKIMDKAKDFLREQGLFPVQSAADIAKTKEIAENAKKMADIAADNGKWEAMKKIAPTMLLEGGKQVLIAQAIELAAQGITEIAVKKPYSRDIDAVLKALFAEPSVYENLRKIIIGHVTDQLYSMMGMIVYQYSKDHKPNDVQKVSYGVAANMYPAATVFVRGMNSDVEANKAVDNFANKIKDEIHQIADTAHSSVKLFRQDMTYEVPRSSDLDNMFVTFNNLGVVKNEEIIDCNNFASTDLASNYQAHYDNIKAKCIKLYNEASKENIDGRIGDVKERAISILSNEISGLIHQNLVSPFTSLTANKVLEMLNQNTANNKIATNAYIRKENINNVDNIDNYLNRYYKNIS